MDLNLAGKHALVCGGSEGIGRAAAIELAQLGADVTVLARRADALQAVVVAPAQQWQPTARTAGGRRRRTPMRLRRRGRGAGRRQARAHPDQQHRRPARRPRAFGQQSRLTSTPSTSTWSPTRPWCRRCCRACARAQLGPHRQRHLDLGERADRQPRRVQHHPRRGGELGQDAVARTRRRRHHRQQRAARLHPHPAAGPDPRRPQQRAPARPATRSPAGMLATVPVGRFAEAQRNRRRPSPSCARRRRPTSTASVDRGRWRAHAVDLSKRRIGVEEHSL